MMNLAARDKHKQQKLLREGTQRTEYSANLANLSEKIGMGMAERNQMDKDLFEVNLLKKQYKDNGIWDRKMEADYQAFINGTITVEELERRMFRVNSTKGNDAKKPIYETNRPNVLKIGGGN